jgi:hypothetical protein
MTRRQRRLARRGQGSVETVMITGLLFVVALIFLPLGLRVCQEFWRLIDGLVGCPYL